MSRATLTSAMAELYGRLADSDGLPLVAGVDAVYDHLPPASTLTGAVSLCVFLAGVTAEFWHIAVRLTLGMNIDPGASQQSLWTLLPAIDTATDVGDTGYGPTAWSIDYPGGDPWVVTATCVYDVGREDI